MPETWNKFATEYAIGIVAEIFALCCFVAAFTYAYLPTPYKVFIIFIGGVICSLAYMLLFTTQSEGGN
jgi:hypothetical protein